MIAVEKSGPIWIAEFEAARNELVCFPFNRPTLIRRLLPWIRAFRRNGVDFILASQQRWNLAVDGWSHSKMERSNQFGKRFGAISLGKHKPCHLVTSACEDNEGNLIVGTLGAGVFWYEPDGKLPADFQGPGLVIRFCAFVVHGSRRKSLGREPMASGLNRIKTKIFNTPAGLRPLAAQSISEDGTGGLWTAFNAHGVTYWSTNSVQDFGVSPHQSAWTVLVDHQQNVWVGTRDEGLFQFQTNHFQPAARLGNSRSADFCLV